MKSDFCARYTETWDKEYEGSNCIAKNACDIAVETIMRGPSVYKPKIEGDCAHKHGPFPPNANRQYYLLIRFQVDQNWRTVTFKKVLCRSTDYIAQRTTPD